MPPVLAEYGSLFVLGALALCDAGFSAFREAAGRNLLIRKKAYYRAAVLRGIIVETLFLTLGLSLFVLLLFRDGARSDLTRDAGIVALRMIPGYFTFGLVVTSCLLLRRFPSLDKNVHGLGFSEGERVSFMFVAVSWSF